MWRSLSAFLPPRSRAAARRPACSVFVRQDDLVVVCHAWTTSDWLIDSLPVYRLRRHTSPIELGHALLQALDETAYDVPEPESHRTAVAPILKETGFKTWTAFTRGALRLSISRTGERIEITASENKGRGVFDLIDETKSCPVDPGAVGQLALSQLARCV